MNLTPENFVALCSSAKTDELVRLNVHLRAQGIDARFAKNPKLGATIKVSPEQREQARKLLDTWLVEGSDVRADYRAIRARSKKEAVSS